MLMSVNPIFHSNLFKKKDRNAVKRQERFEKSKNYLKVCDEAKKMQEDFLRRGK
jgi:hypothetical protein